MKTLTVPQTALIVAIAKANSAIPTKGFDRRVINGLAKAGFVAVTATPEGETVALTDAGKALPMEQLSAKGPKAPKAKAAKKGKKAKAAKGEKKERPVPLTRQPGIDCLCGCGKKTANAARIFRQGHDARMRSLYLKVVKGEFVKRDLNPAGVEYVEKHAHWMTKALKDAFAEAK